MKPLLPTLLLLSLAFVALGARAESFALLVGVSGYPSLPEYRQLRGPRNDVQRMRQVLTEIQQLTNEPLTVSGSTDDVLQNTEAASQKLDSVMQYIVAGAPESLERCSQLLGQLKRQGTLLKDAEEAVIQLQQKEDLLHDLTAQNEELKQELLASERDLAAAFVPRRAAGSGQPAKT